MLETPTVCLGLTGIMLLCCSVPRKEGKVYVQATYEELSGMGSSEEVCTYRSDRMHYYEFVGKC